MGCDAGSALSCAGAAEMLRQGSGDAPKDEARAYDLFGRACAGGEPSGCVGQGWLELNGQGTTKDGPKALASFEKACNDATAVGCFGVGVVLRGGFGVPADFARATAAFHKSCEGKFAVACKAKQQLEKRR